MKQLCINIFCIATHYSNRYNSSDNYINSEIDTNNYYDNIVTDNTLTLKNYTFYNNYSIFFSFILRINV